MAHYAFLDQDNNVVEVIPGKEEGEGGIDWEQHYGEIKGLTCKRTSYNTFAGEHRNNGTPFRKNYATIGGKYDPVNDAFIPPKFFQDKPVPSWNLNQQTFQWEPPVPFPADMYTRTEGYYEWDENNTQWLWVPSYNPDPEAQNTGIPGQTNP